MVVWGKRRELELKGKERKGREEKRRTFSFINTKHSTYATKVQCTFPFPLWIRTKVNWVIYFTDQINALSVAIVCLVARTCEGSN